MLFRWNVSCSHGYGFHLSQCWTRTIKNWSTVGICEWISFFIPHFTGHEFTYPCWDDIWVILVNRAPETIGSVMVFSTHTIIHLRILHVINIKYISRIKIVYIERIHSSVAFSCLVSCYGLSTKNSSTKRYAFSVSMFTSRSPCY